MPWHSGVIRQGMHVTGTPSQAAFLRAIEPFTKADISSKVTQDVLLLAGAKDHFVPLGQLDRQKHALTNARSVTTRLFTAEEHAASHCQIGNLPLAMKVIICWLQAGPAREKSGGANDPV